MIGTLRFMSAPEQVTEVETCSNPHLLRLFRFESVYRKIARLEKAGQLLCEDSRTANPFSTRIALYLLVEALGLATNGGTCTDAGLHGAADLDPLRGRVDFEGVRMDLAFPGDRLAR